MKGRTSFVASFVVDANVGAEAARKAARIAVEEVILMRGLYGPGARGLPQRRVARAFSVSARSASGPTGAPVAWVIQRSGARLPSFAIRSNSGPIAPAFSICRS